MRPRAGFLALDLSHPAWLHGHTGCEPLGEGVKQPGVFLGGAVKNFEQARRKKEEGGGGKMGYSLYLLWAARTVR